MVRKGQETCPECQGLLKYYDSVWRLMRIKYGIGVKILIRRLQCEDCGKIHREIPSDIFPFKHYEAEIILGVLEGLITPNTLGFEDRPCAATMHIWHSQKKLLLLWRNPYLEGDDNNESIACDSGTEMEEPLQLVRPD